MPNVKDGATSLVATAPSPATSGTSLIVSAGEGALFPSAPFYAILHPQNTLPIVAAAEKVLVTAKSTDTFTIVRAQGVYTAKSVAVGWRISNAVFQDDLNNSWKRSVKNITMAAGSTTSTSYVNIPSNSLTLSITKKGGTDTNLIISGVLGFYMTSGGAEVTLGVNVGGTDYDMGKYFKNEVSSGAQISGDTEITGLAAGAYTVTLRVKVNGNTFNVGSSFAESMTVEEQYSA